MDIGHRPWHTLSTSEAALALAVVPAEGLSTAAASERLAHYGENKLAEAAPPPLWRKFFDQFRNFLVLVLLFAAGLAWAIGDLKDAAVILIVVLVNAGLGFWQEHRAERTLAALKEMLAAHARVRRDGLVSDMDASQLVPGDIVLLEAGDRVPGDGRLLAAHNLEAEEAALTGESHAVGKSVLVQGGDNLPLGDRLNVLFMNTVITRGRAELLITETGMKTEMGKLAGMIASAKEAQSPLQRQLDTLAKKLAAIAGFVVAVILSSITCAASPWLRRR